MAINSDGLALPRSAAKFFLHSAGKEKTMSDFGRLTLDQVNDLGNKIGGQERAKRFLSGELILVERGFQTPQATNSSQVSVNGGVTYAPSLNVEVFLDDWAKFFKDVFKLGLPSRKKIILPETRSGFGWGVVAPKGMTIEGTLQGYAGICPVWRWINNNIDNITKSVRNSDTTRVVWVRDRSEADEEYKGLSYNDLQVMKIGGITLLERLLLGRWFYYKTNQHLDRVNISRCDGSIFSGGNVPSVSWSDDDGGLFVGGYDPDFRDDDLRVREVVSL